MAEVVEFHTEETIPELETMMPELFERDEIQDLTKSRKDHEYRMRRTPKRKEDCMKYIDFEMKLIKLIRLRHKKKGLQKNTKISNLERSLNRRLQKLFSITVQCFPSDLRTWMSYIRFCKQMRNFSAVCRALEQMLDIHGSSRPELFRMAANLELHDCSNVEKARQYLLGGIHVHKDNKMLLTELFKLELIDAEKRRKESLVNKIEIDPKNQLLSSKKAEIIYDNSIKKLNDLELMNQLLGICADFDFTKQLEGRIETDMLRHSADERMWDIIARRELTSDDKSSPRDKIKKCINLYERGVQTLNTQRMWEFYIDTLSEIFNDNQLQEKLPKFTRKILSAALQKGDSNGKLQEKHYMLWINLLQGNDKHKKVTEEAQKKLLDVLEGAVKRLPESGIMWQTLMRAHLARGDEKAAEALLDAGTKALGQHALPLWILMLQFEQIEHNNKVEEIFKKSWSECPEISGPLRAKYLEWLVLTQGISVARNAYDEMCNPDDKHPSTLEMHRKMMYLESIQPSLKKKRIKRCHTIACAVFGATNVDVWLDEYKFELEHGAKKKDIELLFNRACENLVPPLRDVFVSQFNVFQNISKSTVDKTEKSY